METPRLFNEPNRYKAGTIEGMDCVFDLQEKAFTPVPAGFEVIESRGGIRAIHTQQGVDANLFWMRVPTTAETSVDIYPELKARAAENAAKAARRASVAKSKLN